MTGGCVVGIDPGLSGAIAFLGENDELDVYDMPVEKVTGVVRRKTGAKRGLVRQIDLGAFACIVDSRAAGVTHAAIERVNSMPGQGIATTMKLGYNFGVAAAMVAASFIPITFVRPGVWKKVFGLKAGDKTASRVCAARLLPEHKRLFGLAKDDGRAEAALLALWLRDRIREGRS